MGTLVYDQEPETTWLDTAKDVAQTADDTVRAAANAATFGMADRFAGFAGGEGTDAEVRKSEAARERSPVASIVGDVAGSMAIPGFGAARLAARYGSGLGARALGYGVTGAGTGAAQGAGTTYTGNPIDYLKNAGIGLGMGAILGAGGGAAFGRRPAVSSAVSPSAAELRAAKNVDYDALNQNRAPYDARYLADRANLLEHDMHQGVGQSPRGRFNERDSPSTWNALGEMRQPSADIARAFPNDPTAVPIIDPSYIDWVRKGVNKIPRTAERATDRESGRLVLQNLDDFVANPPAGAVQPGGEAAARVAAALSERARGNNAAYKRIQRIEELADNAQRQAGSTFSGLNLENELRREAKGFVKERRGVSQATREGFTREERDLLTDFSNGTNYGNFVRWAAKTAGGGSGLGALAAAGIGGAGGAAYTGDTSLASALALPAAGLALRRYGNRMADRNMQALRDNFAQRSPLYQQRLATAPMIPGPGSPMRARALRDAVTYEILKQQSGGGNAP